MDATTTIWLILFAALFLRVPIYVSIGTAAATALVLTHTSLYMLPQAIYAGVDQYPLLAIPCFILAGGLMDRGGVAGRIVQTATMLVGHVRGGLAMVTLAGCAFFAAIIGSGAATTAAMGSLMIPSMIRRAYPKPFAASVSASGGTMGILIPPSNPMIVYGVVGNVSITALFLAGVIPGAMVWGLLSLTAYVLARRQGLKGIEERPKPREVFRALLSNVWSLATPVIILGGIYGGAFTPVEASAIAVVYGLFVGAVIHRELDLAGVIDSIKSTVVTSGMLLLVVGVSILFGQFITLYHVPEQLTASMLSISHNRDVVLVMIILVLFFLGMFIETLSTIIVLTPILLPVVTLLGVDPVHFGIIFVLTNEVALLTPPLGVNLFVAAGISGSSIEQISRAAAPFILVLMLATFLVARFDWISLLLPRLLLGYGH